MSDKQSSNSKTDGNAANKPNKDESRNDGASYDVVIIGGGVNGAGIARDAALRGLSVCLFEKGDLASGTSSASTKLIHGGLRYLEFFDFALVRASLIERALLLRLMPGFIRPLQFVLPHKTGMRSKWLLRLGLFLYDNLGPRGGLPRSRKLALTGHEFGAPLKLDGAGSAKTGFEYADGWVDDARLVVFNALEAMADGAEICPRQAVTDVNATEGGFVIALETGRKIFGRALVNATGPSVNSVIEEVIGGHGVLPLRLVRGSHIVVPRLYSHNRAYILQQADGRVVFTIPYEGSFTLIGTTEAAHDTGLEDVVPSNDEITYLLTAANKDFKRQIKERDIVWSFAGVRPLFDDGKKAARAASRDYHLALEIGTGAPVVHVYGGKITTFRKLSEEVVDLLAPYFKQLRSGRTGALTYTAFEADEVERWAKILETDLSFVPLTVRQRWLQSYGARVGWFLRDVRDFEGLGQYFGGGLYEREVRYLIAHEWARTSEDILYRRTKCGLHLSAEEKAEFETWLEKTSVISGDLSQPL
jgi:glycerol-3-phosphate dehydrogenase